VLASRVKKVSFCRGFAAAADTVRAFGARDGPQPTRADLILLACLRGPPRRAGAVAARGVPAHIHSVVAKARATRRQARRRFASRTCSARSVWAAWAVRRMPREMVRVRRGACMRLAFRRAGQQRGEGSRTPAWCCAGGGVLWGGVAFRRSVGGSWPAARRTPQRRIRRQPRAQGPQRARAWKPPNHQRGERARPFYGAEARRVSAGGHRRHVATALRPPRATAAPAAARAGRPRHRDSGAPRAGSRGASRTVPLLRARSKKRAGVEAPVTSRSRG